MKNKTRFAGQNTQYADFISRLEREGECLQEYGYSFVMVKYGEHTPRWNRSYVYVSSIEDFRSGIFEMYLDHFGREPEADELTDLFHDFGDFSLKFYPALER